MHPIIRMPIRLEADNPQLDASVLHLRNTLDDAVASFTPRAHEKGLELVILVYDDVPDILMGDATRLRQILSNLLDNAIKFTQRGEIIIRAMLDTETADTASLALQVTDTGIGISAQPPGRLLEVCDQASPASARIHSSAGSGLATAYELAKAMHGNIQAESRQGGGSIFELTLTFPKVSDPAHSPKGVDPWEEELRGAHIVLYDSHRLSGLALQHRLAGWGMQVVRCEHHHALVQCLRETLPSPQMLILGLSAGESHLAQETLIRDCRAEGHSTMLILVSSSNNERIEQLRTLGASQCLSKPLPSPTLFRTLKTLLAQGRHNSAKAQPELWPASADLAPSEDQASCDLPARDKSEALRSTGGNELLAADLLATFVKDLPLQLQEIQCLHAKGDWKELREAAHRVHGSTAYCGIPALKRAVQQLEQATQHTVDPLHIGACVDTVGHEVRRLLRYLGKMPDTECETNAIRNTDRQPG